MIHQSDVSVAVGAAFLVVAVLVKWFDFDVPDALLGVGIGWILGGLIESFFEIRRGEL